MKEKITLCIFLIAFLQKKLENLCFKLFFFKKKYECILIIDIFILESQFYKKIGFNQYSLFKLFNEKFLIASFTNRLHN